MDIVEVEKKLKELIEPFLSQREVELVEFSFRRRAGTLSLTLLVDRPEGITINECAEINEELSRLLDREVLIEEHYILEVSSPGLDRSLINDADFKRVLNKLVRIVTSKSISGVNVVVGTLKEFNVEEIKIILEDGQELIIPRNIIARAKLEIRF
ncbi:MAG: ribosome maturation factor RimP [Candidatus Omnitrophica bacterium]|nr:ribosome maturation factor RimP [Candidatus Omnitrophota bacterium]